MRIKSALLITLIFIFLVFSVYHFYPPFPKISSTPPPLTEQFIQENASSPALSIKNATVITDNDSAFSQKLNMVQTAKESIDLAYYIYADDHSSSVLSKALIAAANRGVRVRLLVDYQSTYANFDLFSMLEQYGNQGSGSLEVRFYNRPSINIIKDAVFLTLGCSELQQHNDLKTCSKEKYKAIEDEFAQQMKGKPNTALLNYNNGKSGLFLSAFYAKNPRLMAFAIQQGQSLQLPNNLLTSEKETATTNTQDKTDKLNKLKKALDIYLTARHSNGLDQTMAQLKLKFAMTFFSGKISPYYDALTSYLPIGRSEPRTESLQDWNHITDFFHQKLLLVDAKRFILGGRNIEDTYHMQAHSLMPEYQFMDTEISVELDDSNNKQNKEKHENRLVTAFERLWNFKTMVATTKDIEQHAPNDFVASTLYAERQCASFKSQASLKQCQQSLSKQSMNKTYRIKYAYANMLTKAMQYTKNYTKPKQSNLPSPSFALDTNAKAYYFENIPFAKNSPSLSRAYGAKNGKEAQSGKYIHKLWLSALYNTCQQASAEKPQEVIIHNAYFFMPSNLLRQLGDMVSGKQSCQHVNITILTNSAATTDLPIVNLAAKYSLKALLDHLETAKNNGQNSHSATLSYYEYQPRTLAHDVKPSLHSKVMLFGDHLFIGSANADVRSYMMDANNGLFIHQAPQLTQQYRQWFKQLLTDKKQTLDKTQQLKDGSVKTWLVEDSQQLIATIQQKIGSTAAKTTVLQQPLSKGLQTIFNTIYTLSAESLNNEKSSDEAQQQFNALFKLI